MVHNKATYLGARHPNRQLKAVPSNISTASSKSAHNRHHGPPIPITEEEESSASSFLVCGKQIADGIRVYSGVTVAIAILGLLCAGYAIHHLNKPTHDTEHMNEDLFAIVLIASSLWFNVSALFLIIGVINEDMRLCLTWIAAMALLIIMWITYILYSIITSISETLTVGPAVVFILYLAHGIWVAIHFLQYINEKKTLPPEQLHRYSYITQSRRLQHAIGTLRNPKHGSRTSSHSRSSRNSSNSKGHREQQRVSSSRTLDDSTSTPSEDQHGSESTKSPFDSKKLNHEPTLSLEVVSE